MAKAERNIITDKLVAEKTGKPMEHWFALLDKKGGKVLAPSEIFSLVASLKGLAPLGEWNQNLVATTYGWSRGLRKRGEKADGFEISVSKTVSVPVSVLYGAWLNGKIRDKWLGKEKIVFRKATENKSARITWSDGKTSVSVDFYRKAEDKSQVVVQHLKIANSKHAPQLKEYWGNKLEGLKKLLEK
jgi:hypothetical protein